ncbi:hypothetical protein CC86DRAFT_402222 [Ophiobolus disseminans]|uniref:Uncharacterized protein n=1 Tax=Ophiobolus disseminans TaxID=1469910 RepID=A0A6A7AGB6_9PLEO|nr:hypothetical protein CC86DRAFT_402222 [Ophiobolus disseminans]
MDAGTTSIFSEASRSIQLIANLIAKGPVLADGTTLRTDATSIADSRASSPWEPAQQVQNTICPPGYTDQEDLGKRPQAVNQSLQEDRHGVLQDATRLKVLIASGFPEIPNAVAHVLNRANPDHFVVKGLIDHAVPLHLMIEAWEFIRLERLKIIDRDLKEKVKLVPGSNSGPKSYRSGRRLRFKISSQRKSVAWIEKLLRMLQPASEEAFTAPKPEESP